MNDGKVSSNIPRTPASKPLYNNILMVLSEIIVNDRTDSGQHKQAADSTNSADRWICQ
jgi:hypothetical protein